MCPHVAKLKKVNIGTFCLVSRKFDKQTNANANACAHTHTQSEESKHHEKT
jgi:hypothetical protein